MVVKRRTQDPWKPPDHLDEIARAEWDRVVPELLDLGFIVPEAPFDRTLIELYSAAYSNTVRLHTAIEETGDKVSDELLEAVEVWQDHVYELAAMIGLTPESRLEIQQRMRRLGVEVNDLSARGY